MVSSCFLIPRWILILTVHKKALVRDLWDNSREGGGWIPCFSRSFNDWEVENFLQAI